MGNISKRARLARPTKPEFQFLGIIVGVFAGWLTGAGLEVALGKPKMLIMFAAGFAGFFLGAAVEAIRYFVLLRRYRAAQKP